MKRNFYASSCAPYYIFALDYIQQSAGIRALHYLCHALNESGMEAYVTCRITAPQLRTPILNAEIMMQHKATGRLPIMVYPEIVTGDPLAAGGIVVRWLLNRPGHIGGDTAFSENDLIFAYDQSYLTAGITGKILHIPTYDLSIFNNDNNAHDQTREFVCFYAHKYLSKGGLLTEHVKNAISLCKDQKLTHREIADILRRSKLLYVYEPTALVVEALLCGCPVSIIETDYSRNHMADYSSTTGAGLIVGDDPESLRRAKEEVKNYRTIHEESALKEAWVQLDRFIAITQNAVKARA